jgi:hypothetical protein
MHTFTQTQNGDVYTNCNGIGLLKTDSNFFNPQKVKLLPSVSNLIANLFCVDGITIYLIDNNGFIYSYNSITKICKKENFKNWNNAYPKCVSVVNDTAVWIGKYDGEIICINPQAKNCMRLTPQYFDTTTKLIKINGGVYNGAETWDIEPENDSCIWLATAANGLKLLNLNTKQIVKTFFPDAQTTDYKLANAVHNITRFNNDTLLMSTFKGFIIYNTKTNKAKYYTMLDGLPSSKCYASAVDASRKIIWISTPTHGVCKLNF